MTAFWNKIKNFFLDHINWCHETLSTGSPKPLGAFYKFWCYLFWPIPWMKNEAGEPAPCWCCASVRGFIYGLVLMGFIWGVFG